MQFSKFAEYLQKLEATSKRLEITSILAELLNELSAEETQNAVNLALGQLKAPFESERFNMADKMVIRVIESAYQVPQSEINKNFGSQGDLGTVAQELSTVASISKLTINEVYEKLLKIAKFEGTGSQDKKTEILAKLLNEIDPLSTKFVVRMVLGTTRLGFTSLTIIDALSNVIAGDKSLKQQIEKKYNVHPDIAFIAKKIKKSGIKGIEEIKMETGVPLLAQKPQRLNTPEEVIEKMGGFVWAEYKYDGTRIQLHMDRNKENPTSQGESLFSKEDDFFVKTYTRNLDETTHQFPDIIEAVKTQVNADSVILDGEGIGYDPDSGEYLNFQDTIQRKRKHDVADLAKLIPLKYLVFDLIYLNGKQMIDKPLTERRAALKEIILPGEVVEIDSHLDTKNPKELGEFFKDAKEKGLEGLVVKNPSSEYQAGARSFSWVKLKRIETEGNMVDDTIDCVVLGYYFGKGVRANFGIGGFLAGIYDKENEVFKTITKVGTGLKDDDWIYLKKECEKIKLQEQPSNVLCPKELFPDVWVDPRVVVELRADEISKSQQHTAQYALRFPRLMHFRQDKDAEQITDLTEIKHLYSLQFNKKES